MRFCCEFIVLRSTVIKLARLILGDEARRNRRTTNGLY